MADVGKSGDGRVLFWERLCAGRPPRPGEGSRLVVHNSGGEGDEGEGITCWRLRGTSGRDKLGREIKQVNY